MRIVKGFLRSLGEVIYTYGRRHWPNERMQQLRYKMVTSEATASISARS